MPATHFAKNQEGAVLAFSAVGFPKALVALFVSAAAGTLDLDARARARAETALNEICSWNSTNRIFEGFNVPMWTLDLPISTEGRSAPHLAVDPEVARSCIARAQAFNPQRSFLNALAKAHAWLDRSGKLLEFAPVLGRPLGLARDALWELAESGNIMGSGRSFALYSPTQMGYYETISSSRWSEVSPLSRARLFESAKDARAFATRVKLRKCLTVVEVSVRAARLVEISEGGDHTSLMLAIARAEAAELHALMAESELIELRTRLTTLEAERPLDAPNASEQALKVRKLRL